MNLKQFKEMNQKLRMDISDKDIALLETSESFKDVDIKLDQNQKKLKTSMEQYLASKKSQLDNQYDMNIQFNHKLEQTNFHAFLNSIQILKGGEKISELQELLEKFNNIKQMQIEGTNEVDDKPKKVGTSSTENDNTSEETISAGDGVTPYTPSNEDASISFAGENNTGFTPTDAYITN